jgi:hypothetical protein
MNIKPNRKLTGVGLVLAAVLFITGMSRAADAPASTRRGVTLYVSRLGDNSDGTSWTRAFHSIQAALNAIPDDKGGHTVIVRPDTYAEANLEPAFKGAQNAYNTFVGDWDGSLGSGATGWVIVDSGAPMVVVRTNPKAPSGNPTFMILTNEPAEKDTGLKSVDWWGPIRSAPDVSAIQWDRWIFRRLYTVGSEGGIGWDLTCQKGSPFSVIVEDCVGIGRFAGASVMAHVNRPKEPVVFRRSYFMCLDVWGDAGAVYVRGENPSMPETPDAVFEDCTLVGPDNAVQVGFPGFSAYTRIQFKNCKMLVLNFSQPNGVPSTGAIYSDVAGKFLHIDMESCLVAGYKVFGAKNDDMFSFTLTGTNRAYVQYRQSVPEGFQRLRFWPTEVFDEVTPARFLPPASKPAQRPVLTKLPGGIHGAMENTPFVYQGRPMIALNFRDEKANNLYLFIQDLTTTKELTRFGQGHSFVNAFVNGNELNIFATEFATNDWYHDIYRFWTTNLTNWNRELAIAREPGAHLFNSSVCRDAQGYVMAYESEKPVQFCFQFARSKGLSHWDKIPGLIFTGANNEYSACPVIRYLEPYYYVIYLHAAVDGHKGWVPYIARSKDLAEWELSPFNPILEASEGEGVNNSDIDLFEYQGKTYLYYATGDQATWGDVRTAMFDGPLAEFYQSWFPAGQTFQKVSAVKK